MQCDDARFAHSLRIDDALDAATALQLEAHLANCESCRQFERRVGLVHNAVAVEEPFPDLVAATVGHSRTIRALPTSPDASATQHSGVIDMQDLVQSEPGVRQHHEMRRQGRRRTQRRWLVVAAAASIVAVVAGLVLGLPKGSSDRAVATATVPASEAGNGKISAASLSADDEAAVRSLVQQVLDHTLTGDAATAGNDLPIADSGRYRAFIQSHVRQAGSAFSPLRGRIDQVRARSENEVEVVATVAGGSLPGSASKFLVTRTDGMSPWVISVESACNFTGGLSFGLNLACPLSVYDPVATDNAASADGRAIQATFDRFYSGDVAGAESGLDLQPRMQQFQAVYGSSVRPSVDGVLFAGDQAMVELGKSVNARVAVVRDGDTWRIASTSACRLVALPGSEVCPAVPVVAGLPPVVVALPPTNPTVAVTGVLPPTARYHRAVADALVALSGATGLSADEASEYLASDSGNDPVASLAAWRAAAVGRQLTVRSIDGFIPTASGLTSFRLVYATTSVGTRRGEAPVSVSVDAYVDQTGRVRIPGYSLCALAGLQTSCSFTP